MIHFECDYTEGAHPKVLESLVATNMCQTTGYGNDEFCEKAREMIKSLCGNPVADIHFLVGGTQTNTTVIASLLRPYQGAVAVKTGHINVHETGAIEATGHKVIAAEGKNGKISAEEIEQIYNDHHSDCDHEHCVQPGLVYISFPTELGSIYYKKELEAISATCQRFGLPLFIDGARLGYGLTAADCDVDIKDIARYADIFYIGGTKQGALFGEAVIFKNKSLSRDFRYMIKQKGGLLAKGRLLGLQFAALLEDNLYFDLASHANRLALKIKDALVAKGVELTCPCSTNQQFALLSNEVVEKLSKDYSFSVSPSDKEGYSNVRICTSWATTEENVDKLISDLNKVL